MVMRLILVLAFAACAHAEALQDKPGDVLRKSIGDARAKKTMKVSYKAKVEVPHSDPLHVHGTALVNRENGLLYIEYHASGGNTKFIVRRGDAVLEYHFLIDEWVPAQDLADAAAGRGLSNPNEVFDMILANADLAQSGGDRVLTLDLPGEKIRDLIKFFIEEKEVRWDRSTSQMRVTLAPDSDLPSKIESQATIGWKEGQAIKYSGEVAIESFDKESEHKFQERNRKNEVIREIPLSDAAQKKLGLSK